ncbi:MAG: helix-turn-helix transcriptional regulator [Lachnospiraceae bacterium]|nr:helix-turn-helix transcriptional regulator [Lachnospiraceae bacterium]
MAIRKINRNYWGANKVARRVFELLAERNLSDAQFCRETGFNYSTLNEWRNDRKNPGIDLIEVFCKALGISLGKFFSEGVYAEEDRSHPSCAAEDTSREYVKVCYAIYDLRIEAGILPQMKRYLESNI